MSDPSIANQDLSPKKRRLYRLSQIAQGPAKLRWTHNKNQRFSTGGQGLQDVAPSLRQGAVQPSELPMSGIVRHEMKWYSRNNRRLWCFKAAKAEAVEVCMSLIDIAFLHGLTTQTDGLSVTFFPPLHRKACHKEFVKRKGLQPQVCQRRRASAALPQAEEVSSSLGGCGREARLPSEQEARHFGKHRSGAGRAGEKTLEKDDPKVTHSDKMHRPPTKTLMQKPGLIIAETPFHSP